MKSECSPPNEGVRLHLGKVMLFRTSDRDRMHWKGKEPKGGGGQKRLDRRLQEVAGGYYRLQMPLRLALTVRGTVAGRRLGALEGGGGNPPLPMHPCLTPNPKAVGGGCQSGWGRLLSVAMPLKLALAVRGTVAAPLSKTSATLCSKHPAAAARPGVASDSFPRLHMRVPPPPLHASRRSLHQALHGGGTKIRQRRWVASISAQGPCPMLFGMRPGQAPWVGLLTVST